MTDSTQQAPAAAGQGVERKAEIVRRMVTIASQQGPVEVEAVVCDRVPGLAVTMVPFGRFGVTHIASGHRFGYTRERYGSALLTLAELAAIGAAYGVDFTADDMPAALRPAFDKPVPFEGATSTCAADGERRLTVREWINLHQGGPDFEFPWESAAEHPGSQAMALLDSLTPEAP